MSGITTKLFTILLAAELPMTLGELRPHFDTFPKGRLASLLLMTTHSGALIRTGSPLHFSYRLSDAVRDRIVEKGIAAFVNVVGQTAEEAPRRPVAAAAPAAAWMGARQPQWPAMNRSEPLRPAVGTRLPWADEEELPPCIGERYREALRPRPMDD